MSTKIRSEKTSIFQQQLEGLLEQKKTEMPLMIGTKTRAMFLF